MNQVSFILLTTAFANFITAFGGGSVLGKAIGLIQLPFIHAGSLVAFFVGTVLGIYFLFWGFKKLKRNKEILGAFLGALCSFLMLLILWISPLHNGVLSGWIGFLFFTLLSFRFCFWFLTRILRSDRLSVLSPKAIPLIEGFFHLGTIVSLGSLSIGWVSLGLVGTLILDLLTQLLGGLLDILIQSRTQTVPVSQAEPPTKNTTEFKAIATSVSVFTLVTVVIQVFIFHVSHLVPQSVGLVILGCFYAGLAAAGLLSAYGEVRFVDSKRGFGNLAFGANSRFLISNLYLLFFLMIAILSFFLSARWEAWTMTTVAALLASFVYEIFCFGLLHRIQTNAERTSVDRPIAKAFSVMALGACVSMFALRMGHVGLSLCTFLSIGLLLACGYLLQKENRNPSNAGPINSPVCGVTS